MSRGEHFRSEVGMADALTANLDEPCYSVRDFLVLAAAAREARKPLDAVIDGLLDLVADA